MPVSDALVLVVVGLGASTLFHMFVLPFLPSRVREKVSWWKMSLRKYVLSPSVGVEMVSKAAAAGGEARPAGEARERAAACMRAAGFDVAGKDTEIKAPVRVGRRDLDLSVQFASDENGDFEQAEIVVGTECRYRDFEIRVAEMREAQAKAVRALSEAGMSPSKEFCVVCKLGSLPQAKVLLDSIDAETMSYSTPDGHTFDLYDNKIEYYDTEVHKGMTSFLKKVLVVHS